MIKNKALASRYARAFIEHCAGTIGIKPAILGLKKAKRLLRENRKLREILKNPEIGYTDRYSIVDNVFVDDFPDQVRHFLKLLIENRRIEYFPDIVEFARIRYSHEGREEALIKTSYPLDLEVIEKIEESLQKKFKRKFKFYIELDSSLLGGIKVVIGNTVIDGSVRKRMDDLKEKIRNVQGELDGIKA